jgi:hypothetical protein
MRAIDLTKTRDKKQSGMRFTKQGKEYLPGENQCTHR